MSVFPSCLAVISLTFTLSISSAFAGRDTLTQLSTIDALLNGLYDGSSTLGELNQYGDFGIGTFDKLDGEMVILDGVIYQIKADGKVYVPSPELKTPFAAMTYFDADAVYALPAGTTFESLEAFANKRIPTPNLFYALRIKGVFKTLKARSVPQQSKPYPPLKDVVKHQSIFKFENVRGMIVGLLSPVYVKGLNVPGYHLHFLTEDRKAGGHVLSFELSEGKLELDETNKFSVLLPKSKAFFATDLTRDKVKELESVEK